MRKSLHYEQIFWVCKHDLRGYVNSFQAVPFTDDLHDSQSDIVPNAQALRKTVQKLTAVVGDIMAAGAVQIAVSAALSPRSHSEPVGAHSVQQAALHAAFAERQAVQRRLRAAEEFLKKQQQECAERLKHRWNHA